MTAETSPEYVLDSTEPGWTETDGNTLNLLAFYERRRADVRNKGIGAAIILEYLPIVAPLF